MAGRDGDRHFYSMVNNDKLIQLRAEYLEQKKKSRQHAEKVIIDGAVQFVAMIVRTSPAYYCYDKELKPYIIGALIKAFETYDENKKVKLSTWCFRICYNLCYDFVKERSTRTRKAARWGVNFDSLDGVDAVGADAWETIEENERQRATEKQLDEILRSTFQDVIAYDVYKREEGLFGYKKHTRQEIADALRVTLRSVIDISNQNKKRLNELKKRIQNERN